jgi:hypothetical protein
MIRRLRGRRIKGAASTALLAGLIPIIAVSALAYLYLLLDGSDYRGIYRGRCWRDASWAGWCCR